MTPLSCAICSGKIDIAKLLVTKGADINLKDGGPYKRTPIFYASKHGHKDIAELLIKNGADLNAKDMDANE